MFFQKFLFLDKTMIMIKVLVRTEKLATSILGTSVRAPVMKEPWIDCCMMSPRLCAVAITTFVLVTFPIAGLDECLLKTWQSKR